MQDSSLTLFLKIVLLRYEWYKPTCLLCLKYFSSTSWFHRICTTVSRTFTMNLQAKGKITCQLGQMYKEKGQAWIVTAWKPWASGSWCSYMKRQLEKDYGRLFCFPGLGKHLCYHHVCLFVTLELFCLLNFLCVFICGNNECHPLPTK